MHPNDLLTTHEAADYLRTTYWGFDAFVRRHSVPCERYGRKRLFRRSVLDRMIRIMAERPQYRRGH
jgi:excisionase family DNA binding protein